MLDYYALLEVPTDADLSVIKKKYRVLAKKYHPDLNPNDEKAHKRFVQISEAYKTLSDASKRKKYDDLRKNQGHSNRQKRTAQQEEPEPDFTYKNSKEESVKVDFENWDVQFEDFFGFNPRSGDVNKEKMNKKVHRNDTSKQFEDFFGFRKPPKK